MNRASDIDHEAIRQLARTERDGGCADAPEIGRRVARTVASAFARGEDGAYENLLGLAAQGAAYYGRSVLKEHGLRVTRRGRVVTISGAYALPAGVADSSNGSDGVSERTLYVQFDLMTWAEFHTALDLLRDRRDALTETVVTFEEIAKLEATYPDALVGEAIQTAGLDLSSRVIDLDSWAV